MDKIEFPIRINRFLLLKKMCSRREADRWIERGWVKVNGKSAEIGQQVEKDDEITISKSAERKMSEKVYLAYHKPVGIVTHTPEKYQKSIEDIFRYKTRVFPMGRLDRESCGLIILTNDGQITDKLLNPKFVHEKEYEVTVGKKLHNNFVQKMSSGVKIDGKITRECDVRQTGPQKFRVILTEGRNRQIRKMCEILGYFVTDLRRIRILNVEIGDLRANRAREINGEELKDFLSSLD